MRKIFIIILLLCMTYTIRLKFRDSLTEISDNLSVAIYHRKEKLYISTDGKKITTSQTLRANEQFILNKIDDYWCIESNNYENSYLSIDGSSCINRDCCGIVSMSNKCEENEKFEIIHRLDIGNEFFAIRSVKYNLYIHLEKHLPSYEAIGNRGIVNGRNCDNVEEILFEFMKATQGEVM